MNTMGSKPGRKIIHDGILLGSFGNDSSILDIGISDNDFVSYRNGSRCRYWNSSEIGMKGFSPKYFVRISKLEISMSDIADIKADVDARL